MQARMSRKFVAVILANGMRNELHPITMNFPIANLPVGNKKLIVFQLEQLESIQDMDTILVVYSQDSIKVRQFLQGQFIPTHPHYPHRIQFFKVDNAISQYSTLHKLLTHTAYDGFDDAKGIVIVPRDLISSISFSAIVSEHVEKHCDLTMLLKQKKEYGKDEKKPEVDYEPQVDVAMLNSKGEIFALRSIENYEYLGFSLPPSVYQRVSMASFQKVVDTRLYVFSPRIIKIVKNLQNQELCNLKNDFIDTLIRNQNNSTLLDCTREKSQKPLKVVGKLAGQNEYIRSVININIYESVNLDSLIRGPKQKQPLMPTVFTQPMDEKYMTEFRGSLIGRGCEIEPGIKLTRNVIEGNCRIGKGVEISNSIVMSGSIIEDGCKVSNSIIGPNCVIRAQSMVSFCQFAMGCVTEKGSSIEKEMIIPAQ